ncbi:hypothetical protein K504DRAFT_502278 [Pleomassaria siparia CBS 279.74]|uniref:Mid2 domain-containing protein n=1 Tax=Pleomassaria siparia CBS 279.74 TaxID=1314801 RepID=A0A6G1K9R2_9PLEO|nr:hypothetical protein K504DRAFT_502278 [Pleomassaria siparia CBS 279.74]
MALSYSDARNPTQCYFPKGQLSTDTVCDTSASVSLCCASSHICLSNGLCAVEATGDTGIRYGRGACTDKTWKSPLCPPVCHLNQETATNSSAYDFRAGGVRVWECGTQGFVEEAAYCCESKGERQRCCSTSSAVFRLVGATEGLFTGSAFATSSIFTSPTSTASASSASGAMTGSDTTSQLVSTATTDSPLLPTATNTQTPSNNGTRKDNRLGIGAGVGGALGGCLLVAFIVFLFRWQMKKNAKAVESLRQEILQGKEGESGRTAHGYYGSTRVELSETKHLNEMPTHQNPIELPDSEQAHELPQPHSTRRSNGSL